MYSNLSTFVNHNSIILFYLWHTCIVFLCLSKTVIKISIENRFLLVLCDHYSSFQLLIKLGFFCECCKVFINVNLNLKVLFGWKHRGSARSLFVGLQDQISWLDLINFVWIKDLIRSPLVIGILTNAPFLGINVSLR